ncbi:hypothetical protein DL766_002315 [Monosporascus sp. MC13-8B]|uniref:Uncharacterized protein n=1 Tax=Monosporascus cannonballus TaxID=155416 RepID=A0ABY0HFJ4_9PEZI|nr:hypothetical protein DL762_001900 [Monosporascus cannonballus]RYO99057.1 hypothetical protein DL763_001759 [Monosporascus cannonballus]RYP35848.1 hypothetical protein DL766_002315 [Monosporascus sp. MC13-8B]
MPAIAEFGNVCRFEGKLPGLLQNHLFTDVRASVNVLLNVWCNRWLFPDQLSSGRAEELGEAPWGTLAPFAEETGTKIAFLGKLTGADYGKPELRTQWKTSPWMNGNVLDADGWPKTKRRTLGTPPGPFPDRYVSQKRVPDSFGDHPDNVNRVPEPYSPISVDLRTTGGISVLQLPSNQYSLSRAVHLLPRPTTRYEKGFDQPKWLRPLYILFGFRPTDPAFENVENQRVNDDVYATRCLRDEHRIINKGYYSPGICPSGYTEACSRANSVGTVTEWAYTCCPSVESYSYSCLPTAHLQWDLTLGCRVSMSSGTFTLFDITATELNGQMSVQSSTVGNDFRIGAHAIEVRRQATDASLTAATISRPSDTLPAGTGGAISGSESNGRNSSSNGSNNATESGSSSTGFPPGVAAGIGVGGTVALLGLGLGVFFLCRRRRATKKALSTEGVNLNASPLIAATVETTSPGDARGYYAPEGAKAFGTFEQQRYGGAYEMEADTTVHEIGPGNERYELQTERETHR